MSISELTRWLMLGLVTDDEVKKEWAYQPGMDFEKLNELLRASEKYSKGKTERQIEFLEIRLPLFIREKSVPAGDFFYYIEMEKIRDGKVFSTIKTNALASRPSDEYACRLMEHLGAHLYRVQQIRQI